MKNIFPGLWFIMILSFAGGCSRGEVNKAKPPVPVLTVKAVGTNVPVLIDPPPVGHVLPVLSVTIHPQIGGIINTVNFQEGLDVKKGDLLFTIDPRPAQAALLQAQAGLQRDAAQMQNSKVEFNRQQKLFEQKLISEDDYDTSKSAYDALAGTVAGDRAGVTNAELNLEYTQIRSPIDGRTGSLQFHEGSVVKSPDDVLLTINQVHPVYVAFAVPEQFLPEIKKQMLAKKLKVSVTFENMTGPPPQGELTFVDNAVDTTTGTILLKATFPNDDGMLWPGQFVRVGLTLSELVDAVVVPSQAVQVGQNGQFVYVVQDDQTVEQRPVRTGIAFKNNMVVQSGLKAGEVVVTDGQLRLAPKMKVTVKRPDSAPGTNAP